MSEMRYRVCLVLDKVSPDPSHGESVGDHFECATFLTCEEAQDFIAELLQNHCACASGESELMGELTSPEFMTAGD